MADYSISGFGGIIRTSDGASIPIDVQNSDYRDYLQWEADGGVADPYEPPPPPSVISVSDFWGRFTGPEQTAIMTAAVSNPAISGAMAFAAVIGRVDLLSGPIVSSWTTNLVAAGLITSARRTAILTP
jgi:hypothetical protein